MLFFAVFDVILIAQDYNNMKSEIPNVVRVKDGLVPIWQSNKCQPGQVEYFRYYGLDIEPGKYEHFFGTFDSNDFTLAAHVYRPKEEYKATVVILPKI